MTGPAVRSRRARRTRGLVVAVVAVLAVVAPGCSDAHTPEEKAWVDDGIDPRVVTLFAPSRFQVWVDEVAERYGELDPRARVVVATAEEFEALQRVAANPGPSIWLGDPGHLVDEDEPERPRSTTLVGGDPLSLAWTESAGEVEGGLEVFGRDDRPTGLMDPDAEGGAATYEVLAEHGIDPRPTETYTDAYLLVDALRMKEVTAGLVPRSYAASRFPAVTSVPLEGDDARPRPVELRQYGRSEIATALMGWLTEAEQLRPLWQRYGLQPALPGVG